MAVDQIFHVPSPSIAVGDPIDDDELSFRKIKFLCSFGGKILPRPSDGALRYAGGQTRIIALRRGATLPELYSKFADAYGGPVFIRYQLPDEGLDSLVSVSSAEDLENMMDEYDELAEASGDGSAKLRVFLFSQLEMVSEAAGSSSTLTAAQGCSDGGQRHIDAVNGLATSEAGGICLKASTASAGSTQNSEVGDGSNHEGVSPTISSRNGAVVASNNPSSIVSQYQSFPADLTVVCPTSAAVETQNPHSVAPLASQAYLDTHKVQYVTAHPVDMTGEHRLVNVVAIHEHPYLSYVHVPLPSVSSLAENPQPAQGLVESFLGKSHYDGRVLQPLPDQNCTYFQHNQSQFPPLHPSQTQSPGIGHFGLYPLPPLPRETGFRFVDCHMCQKSLPHAHSDTFVEGQRNFLGASLTEAHSTLQVYPSEEIARLQAQHGTANAAMVDNLLEPQIENFVAHGQFGDYGAYRIPEQILEKEKLVAPNSESFDRSVPKQTIVPVNKSGVDQPSFGALANPLQPCHDGFLLVQPHLLHGEQFDHARVFHLPVTVGFSSTAHTPYGVCCSPPQPSNEDSFQQQKVAGAEHFDPVTVLPPPCAIGLAGISHPSCEVSLNPPQPSAKETLQQQEVPHTLAPPPFPPMHNVIKVPLAQGSRTTENPDCQALDLLGGSVLEIANDYVRPVVGMMEALEVSTFENMRLNEPLKPTLFPNLAAFDDIKSQKSALVGVENLVVLPQNEVNVSLPNSALISNGIVFYGISVEPDKLANKGILMDKKPEMSSLVGENNSLANSSGSAFLSGNSFVNPGLFYEANSLRPATHLQGIQFGDVNQTTNSITNKRPYYQNLESADLGLPHDAMFGIAPCRAGFARDDGTILLEGHLNVESSLIHPMNLQHDMAFLARERIPFQASSSNCTNESMGQFFQNCASDSLFCDQDPWEFHGKANMDPLRPNNVANREPPIPDVFNEDLLSDSKVADMALLLEECSLQTHVDSLNSGEDYVKQDLRDLAVQVGESVLRLSRSASPVLCTPKENKSSPAFQCGTGISKEISDSHSATELGYNKFEDVDGKQSDKVHFVFAHADVIGHLQIIKNSDLEELRELGSGTFGTLYHGKWKGSDVAIKRINDRCFAGKPLEQELMMTDFWNEASKLADLHHPNVVAFYGIVLDGPGGSFATITEYMVNGSLRNALLSNENKFDRRKRLLIAMDVAFGMEYLHEKNIIHFDLKSDNLLVNLRDPQRPICKVGDLGLSKVKCKTLISGGVRGTLPWMAPELLNGSSSLVSEKVDVFSFGIVMWELLTGQEPYADLHYGAIIGGIVSNTLRPPVPESCCPEWKALMQQCWVADPSLRPNFVEVADRLRSMAASQPPLKK